DPVKVKPWKTVYDASIQREGCAQYSMQIFEVLGNEDCLYNNIYISKDYAPIVPMGAFLPTIDEGDQAVLPESPRKLLQTM
ncbi:Carboxylesterase 5A, partial [Sarracenia purpurea var. burkii]